MTMIATPYHEFVEAKRKRHSGAGIANPSLNTGLYDFQSPPVAWGLKKGVASLNAGTGLGKTAQQGAFAEQIPGRRLIIAPLGVTGQTIEECGRILNLEVIPVRQRSDVGKQGVFITNYDRLHHVEDIEFEAVLPDEFSIIKNYDGATCRYMTDRFRNTPFKFPASATPAPNSPMELGTQSEFLGIMTRQEMLATFYTHDGGDTSQWRLKRHAREEYYQWVASWACMYNRPSDLGFSDEGYDLPPLTMHDCLVEVESDIAGGLFGDGKVSATENYAVLRASAVKRCELAAHIVSTKPEEPWAIWCHTDQEQSLLERMIPHTVSVRGGHTRESKEDRLLGFAKGKYPRLITKPRIGAWGMNFQICPNFIVCGVTYSWELMYQLTRRFWRFGQQNPVHGYLVTCNAQESIKAAQKVKESNFYSMADEIRPWVYREVIGIAA